MKKSYIPFIPAIYFSNKNWTFMIRFRSEKWFISQWTIQQFYYLQIQLFLGNFILFLPICLSLSLFLFLSLFFGCYKIF